MTLRHDATRLRIVPADPRRYRAVVARQGQVLLDTDFDQQVRHHLERVELETADILGSPGRLVVPASGGGFAITPDGAMGNFNIGAGHGYMDGWLVENAAACKLATQPHPRTGDAISAPGLIALKALVRHVDPVEEPVLADAALGDAQASGRALVDWQVFPFGTTGAAGISCATALANADWQKLAAPSTGGLAVTVATAAASTDPCSLTPGGGYTRLENLLYRIEVHDGVVDNSFPTIDGPRFGLAGLRLKISRRNASIMVRVAKVAGATLTVVPPALDPRAWFAPGLYAEIVSIHDDVDPRKALAKERLFRIAQATDNQVVLEATTTQIADTTVAADGTWFLRLWDAFAGGDGAKTVTITGAASVSDSIDLGDGLSIALGKGAFRRGDYWTWSARTGGAVDWPMSGANPQMMTPHGPEVRYAPLAVIGGTPAAPVFEDCRIPFATLTDRALFYRGGDGQSIMPPPGGGMTLLPGKLRVAVMRGETPVKGATVRWSFLEPAGGSCQINGAACNAATPISVQTDADGLAEVGWSIDAGASQSVHKVSASIVDGTATSRPPIVFEATFETAAQTSYAPGKCANLAGVTNVQDALDVLCSKIGPKRPKTMRLTAITLSGAAGDNQLIAKGLILNGQTVQNDAFLKAISFAFDLGVPDGKFQQCPVVEVVIDLPYPITTSEQQDWNTLGLKAPFGFRPVRLDGAAEGFQTKAGGGLRWIPSPAAVLFLQKGLPSIQAKFRAPLVCRIRLRSALIWVKGDEETPRIYLNAEHLGTSGGPTGHDLLQIDPGQNLKDDDLNARDPQRAADLDMYVLIGRPVLKAPRNVGAKTAVISTPTP